MAENIVNGEAAAGNAGRDRVNALVTNLMALLRSEDLRIASAYLYGSHASGTAGPDSDIDVAIVSPDLAGDRLQDWIRLTFLATSIDPRFEVVGFRPDQFRDEHPLAWEIKTRGIQLQ